jgi:hypothetical protein
LQLLAQFSVSRMTPAANGLAARRRRWRPPSMTDGTD